MEESMACILTRVIGQPACDMKGAAGAKVTLKLVATKGSAMFESASYDGEPIIAGAVEELTFTMKEGSKRLTLVCVFSSQDGAAELREKCDSNTLLDGNVTAVNNGKLYHVLGLA